MPLLDNNDLERFYVQAEQNLSTEKAFLFDRVGLTIQTGVNIYTLPEYCLSIRRITWLGWALDPLPRRNFREVFQSARQQSRPFWYIYDNIGQQQIQLFPAPMLNLAAPTDLWNKTGSNSWETGCVVEFVRLADSSRFIVPRYLRRQLLKLFVAKQVFLMDNSNMNIKASKYFEARWELRKKRFFDFIDELHYKPRKVIVNEIVSSNYFPMPPVLPIDKFGQSVDEGY